MQRELISVIMPIYNSEKYLSESIESILSQYDQNFELLLVNDGSTDNSKEICLKYVKKYHNVYLINTPNKGVSAARNLGINYAKGEYITFLDADDLWERNYLQLMRKKITSSVSIKFIAAEYDKILTDTGKREKGVWQYPTGRFDAFVHKNGDFRPPFHIGSIMVKRSLLEQYHICFHEGYKHSEDIGFFLKILCVTEVHFVNEVLEHYRVHNDSVSLREWKIEDIKDRASAVLVFDDAVSYCDLYYPQKAELMRFCRNYKAYRFIRYVLQLDTKQALFYINEWSEWLKSLCKSKGKLLDRLKCYFMLTQNEHLLYFCRSRHSV